MRLDEKRNSMNRNIPDHGEISEQNMGNKEVLVKKKEEVPVEIYLPHLGEVAT